MQFRLGELFSGPGGIGYAATVANATSNYGEKFTIKHVWATDYDKDTCDTYLKNIVRKKSKSVICSDIRNLDFKKLDGISNIDGLAFGFPCNDFSMVGEQKGINGTFGPLLGEYFRNRLNVTNGELVTMNDLVSYGRADIDFYKVDEENYFMDFSVQK